jgi:hypothetical protein
VEAGEGGIARPPPAEEIAMMYTSGDRYRQRLGTLRQAGRPAPPGTGS